MSDTDRDCINKHMGTSQIDPYTDKQKCMCVRLLSERNLAASAPRQRVISWQHPLHTHVTASQEVHLLLMTLTHKP